jgi:hypothetical protein
MPESIRIRCRASETRAALIYRSAPVSTGIALVLVRGAIAVDTSEFAPTATRTRLREQASGSRSHLASARLRLIAATGSLTLPARGKARP